MILGYSLRVSATAQTVCNLDYPHSIFTDDLRYNFIKSLGGQGLAVVDHMQQTRAMIKVK